MLKSYFLVGLGCALGGLVRFWLTHSCIHAGFPLMGTLLVNVIGCFFAGLLISMLYTLQPHQEFIRHFLIIGFLGGLTTFSAFSLDLLLLARDAQLFTAALHLGFNVVLSLFAVMSGYLLGSNQIINWVKGFYS